MKTKRALTTLPNLRREIQFAGQNCEELTIGFEYLSDITEERLLEIEHEAKRLLLACENMRQALSGNRIARRP